MIIHQLEPGTYLDYIGADGFYGNECELAYKIGLLGLTYMFEIYSDQPVYLKKRNWLFLNEK